MRKVLVLLLFFTLNSWAAPKQEFSNWEVRTAPIAYLAKWITLDLSYVTDSFAFGPSIISYASPETVGGMLAPTYNGLAYGGNFVLAETLYRNSLYLSGHAYAENFRSYPHAFLGYQNRTGGKANIVLGYRWVNIDITSMFGVGMEFRNHKVESVNNFTNSVTEYNENTSLLHIEFKIGYLF